MCYVYMRRTLWPILLAALAAPIALHAYVAYAGRAVPRPVPWPTIFGERGNIVVTARLFTAGVGVFC
jgi:hypothetical protein